MDEWNMWSVFLTTGSVLDYIRYKSIQNSKNTGADTVIREVSDEIPNGRTDSQRNEYR
ncbi:MAG: hypothetical protein UH734_09500 [Ruminococcus sp.]|nr:hypothetical protein [Ruminococcus sp.]